MPVTYLIHFTVRPERRERFLELLGGVLDAMRAERMFHQAMLHVDPDDENRLMLCETWEDHDDVLAVQLHRPYREEYHRELDDLLAGPRTVEIWRPVRADRSAITIPA